MRAASPVSWLTPTNSRSRPKTTDSARLPARLCSSAPASPPPALVSPKLRSTRRSTCARRRQKRSAVASTCGTDTAATASRVPTRSAKSGVSRLPMPNPATDAMPPARNPSSSPQTIPVNRLLSLVIAAPVLVFASAAPAQRRAAAPPSWPAPPAWRAFVSLFDSASRGDSIVGAAVLLERDGRVVAHHEYGWGDRARGQRVTGRTLFHYGSITKTLTAIAIMQLRDCGRL